MTSSQPPKIPRPVYSNSLVEPLTGCMPGFSFRSAGKACDEVFVTPGQRIVLTAGLPLGTPGATNMLRIADDGKGGAARS